MAMLTHVSNGFTQSVEIVFGSRDGVGGYFEPYSYVAADGMITASTQFVAFETSDGAQQGGPSITGAFINTNSVSPDFNCADCLANGLTRLGTNVLPSKGYANGIEIQFQVKGNTKGYNISIARTMVGGSYYYNGNPVPIRSFTEIPTGNMQVVPVNGIIYSLDAPGFPMSINSDARAVGFSTIGVIMNFTETATIRDGNGAIVSQYSVPWNSSIQIGRSSPDTTFQYLGGSIGPGHVKY